LQGEKTCKAVGAQISTLPVSLKPLSAFHTVVSVNPGYVRAKRSAPCDCDLQTTRYRGPITRRCCLDHLAFTYTVNLFCAHIPSHFATQPTTPLANMEGKKRAAPAAEQPSKVSLSSHHCRHVAITRAMLTPLAETQDLPRRRAARDPTPHHSVLC